MMWHLCPFFFSPFFGFLSVSWYIRRSLEWEIIDFKLLCGDFYLLETSIYIKQWFISLAPRFQKQSESLLLLMWLLSRSHGTSCMDVIYCIHAHSFILWENEEPPGRVIYLEWGQLQSLKIRAFEHCPGARRDASSTFPWGPVVC